MRWLRTIVLALCIALVTTISHGQLSEQVIANSVKYLGLKENSGENDHPMIDKMLAYLGLPPRLSWCAAFVIWNYHEAGYALPKLGRVATLWKVCKANQLRYKTFTTKEVLIGAVQLEPADIPVWQVGAANGNGDFNGHTGLVLGMAGEKTISTREGNTTSGEHGDQRNGGGVYDRKRVLTGTAFQIIGFIRVRG